MNFVDELREKERNKIKERKNSGFLNVHFANVVKGECLASKTHSVKGYYYVRYGYDYDTYGIMDNPYDETTHLINFSSSVDDINVLEPEMKELLLEMGFIVNSVNVSRHSKSIQVDNGYGMFNRKKYKSVPVDYIQIYIDIEW